MFCSLAWMGITLVAKRKAAITAGAGCDVAGPSLDDFGGKPGHEQLCHPAGLESAPRATGRIMASVLGRAAQRVRESGAARGGRARAGCSGMVRPLAVGHDCGVGLASVLTDQCGVQSPLARRGDL